MDTGGTPRRTLLQRGLALLAGGVALATGTRVMKAEADTNTAPAPGGRTDPRSPRSTLTLYARQRPLPPLPAASRPASAELTRQLAAGDLFDAPNGRRVGTVHTNRFGAGAPFGPPPSASDLEFQMMQLDGGTLFGMGGGESARAATLRAIVGGTGRYAGARGAYLERQAAGQGDVVEFVIMLEG
jgi:hypothetical protein